MPVMSAADLQAFLAREFPQIAPMRIRVDRVDERSIGVSMPVGNEHLRPGETVSGPTMMALADTAMYLMILAQIGPVALAVTTNLNINFLRKPTLARLVAKGRLLRLGKRLAVGEVEIFSEGESDPVAHVTLTYSIPSEWRAG